MKHSSVLPYLVKTPLYCLLFHVAVAVHFSHGPDDAVRSKLADRRMDDIDNVLGANVEVDVTINSFTLDAKFAGAILHQLMLLLDGVFHLPLAQRILDVGHDLQTVVDLRRRGASLVDERRVATVANRLQCIAGIVGHVALFGVDCCLGRAGAADRNRDISRRSDVLVIQLIQCTRIGGISDGAGV